MTVEEFAAITRRVIDRNGFDEFLPTACYPERRVIRALEDLPGDIDPEPAVLKWARKEAKAGEEFLIAFKSAPAQFTIIRQHGQNRESGTFELHE